MIPEARRYISDVPFKARTQHIEGSDRCIGNNKPGPTVFDGGKKTTDGNANSKKPLCSQTHRCRIRREEKDRCNRAFRTLEGIPTPRHSALHERGFIQHIPQASCKNDQHECGQSCLNHAPAATTHLVEGKSNHIGEENDRKGEDRVGLSQSDGCKTTNSDQNQTAELSTLELLHKHASKQNNKCRKVSRRKRVGEEV